MQEASDWQPIQDVPRLSPYDSYICYVDWFIHGWVDPG